ncbi:hypothetical protein [Thalassococcus sp. S3]|uniref:hypothetical protein n=1 Tax=Thalassococcus sp. S3 TaxID=2017482 RepID=UPI001023FCF1|nr:hypothetical protein [Thalassococcus sp. S3]QBF33645.1 hypothetical protein CFI11_20855 [Thalassococcus sp. S3]
MTRVDSGAWIAKAKRRKAYRDQARDKFFREVGMQKGAQAQDHTGAPISQRVRVTQLLNLTRKGDLVHGDHQAMATVMAVALGSTGLGTGGAMGNVAETQDMLDRHSIRNLRDTWFSAPVFFD